jgi:hypothetical protein
VVWVCSTLPGGVGPLALYYSRSDDGGFTWSMAQVVATQPVRWAELLSPDGQTLQLIWEETQAGRVGQWQSMSADDGQTWTDPAALPAVEGLSGPASVVADASGQLHLLQLVQESSAAPLLRYTFWDGQTWTAGESWPTALRDLADVTALVSTIDVAGRLVAAYVDSRSSREPGTWQNEIVLAVRPLDLPANATPITPLLTPAAATPEPLTTPEATRAVSATTLPASATPTPPAPNLGSQPPPGDNSALGLVIGVAAALGFVGVIVVVRRRFFGGGQPLN